MKLRLLSTNLKSQSLKRLAEGLSTTLGYKVWRSDTQKPNRKHLLYGDQKGKIEQYQFFQQQQIPALDFTTDASKACEWLNQDLCVVGRKLTHASEGKGIVLMEGDVNQVFQQCPVYTLYKKKKKEFRVHVFKDQVVHVLEKRKRADFEGESNPKIRNTANGYVFCSENVIEPDGIRELALKARKVTNSDFAGVDIGYNEKRNELFVIEVNSAPGIEGSNVDRYVQTILQAI